MASVVVVLRVAASPASPSVGYAAPRPGRGRGLGTGPRDEDRPGPRGRGYPRVQHRQLAPLPVTDGRGLIQLEIEGAGMSAGSATSPPPAIHKEWLPAADRVLELIASRGEKSASTAVRPRRVRSCPLSEHTPSARGCADAPQTGPGRTARPFAAAPRREYRAVPTAPETTPSHHDDAAGGPSVAPGGRGERADRVRVPRFGSAPGRRLGARFLGRPGAAKRPPRGRRLEPGNIDGDPGKPEPPSAAREWAAAPHDSRKLTVRQVVASRLPQVGEKVNRTGESAKGGGINRGRRGDSFQIEERGADAAGAPYEARKRAMWRPAFSFLG